MVCWPLLVLCYGLLASAGALLWSADLCWCSVMVFWPLLVLCYGLLAPAGALLWSAGLCWCSVMVCWPLLASAGALLAFASSCWAYWPARGLSTECVDGPGALCWVHQRAGGPLLGALVHRGPSALLGVPAHHRPSAGCAGAPRALCWVRRRVGGPLLGVPVHRGPSAGCIADS
jgi:hypothetical protein